MSNPSEEPLPGPLPGDEPVPPVDLSDEAVAVRSLEDFWNEGEVPDAKELSALRRALATLAQGAVFGAVAVTAETAWELYRNGTTDPKLIGLAVISAVGTATVTYVHRAWDAARKSR